MIKTIKRISLVSLLSFALVFAFAQSANAALTVGALTIASDGALTLTGAVGSAVSLGTTATTGTIAIGSASTTGGITIGGTSMTTGGTTIYGGTGTGAITMTPGTAGTIVIGKTDGTGAITLGSSSGTQTVNVGTGTGATTINIATADTNANTINIGTAAVANVITIGSAAGGAMYYQETSAPNGDTSIAAEPGSLQLVGAAGDDLTLPAPANGLHFDLVIDTAFATTDMTIITDSSDNIIYGTIMSAGADVACAAEDTITIEADDEAIGDLLQFRSNGTNWYVTGNTTGTITCTQAS